MTDAIVDIVLAALLLLSVVAGLLGGGGGGGVGKNPPLSPGAREKMRRFLEDQDRKGK